MLRNFALFVGLTTGKHFVPEVELFDIWASCLRDLTADQIRAAGENLMKVWRYPSLPTPGDVRAQIELQWARKRFIADYTLVHETGKVEHLLAEGQAKTILCRLRAELPSPNRKQLRAAQTPAIDTPRPSREEVREALNHAAENRERPRTEPSETELRRRAEDQKRRLEALGYDVRTPAPTAEELLARHLVKGQPPKISPIASPQVADSVDAPLAVSEAPQSLVSGGQR